MKSIGLIVAAACIAFASPVQAQDRVAAGGGQTGTAVGDTELVLYRFPGVRDNGGAINTGVATSFHCTNFSGVPEIVRIVIRNFNTDIVANAAFNIPHLRTHTASTHGTVAFNEDAFLSPGSLIEQGTAAIASTTTSLICTAMILDASTAVPNGISLRGVRFNPAPGSQE